MAIQHLATDYVDEVLSGTRKFQMTENLDDTVSFTDVSTYTTEGSGYGASDLNTTNGTVNDVIDLAEACASNITALEASVSNILNGTTQVPVATNARNANNATLADRATTADTATLATTATTANTANTATTATTAQSVSNDFILTNKQALSFTNNVCTISDSRITENSLADVYFTSECINSAQKAVITVETSTGKVTITAGRTPTSTLTASIRVRTV